MTIRTFLLYAVLLVVGAGAFQDALESQRERREALRARWTALCTEANRVTDANRTLRRQIVALQSDRYYVERVARAQLRWRPPAAPTTVPLSSDGADVLLAYDLPSLEPEFDSPLAKHDRTPPQPMRSPEERGARALAALGYGSVEDFQRKMLEGAPTRQFDERTVRRAEELVALIQGLGFDTVKALQRKYRLKPDGILGPKTEELAVRELAKATNDARGTQALAALGYTSLEHFQRKMLTGPPTRTMDERTVKRAEELVGLIAKAGFESVKAFQEKNGLEPDGVLGPRTAELAARAAERVEQSVQVVQNDRGAKGLAALGYTSLEHFQRKMLHGPPTLVMDGRTTKRVDELLGLVAKAGFNSVKDFQKKNGLKPDGVLGRKTEELVRRAVDEATLGTRAKAALVALGYTSVEHFQRKMMSGRATGRFDRATQRRAVALAAMIRSLGFASVKEFQARNGLKPDGVFGRQTEKRAAKLLRTRGRRVNTSASVASHEPAHRRRAG